MHSSLSWSVNAATLGLLVGGRTYQAEAYEMTNELVVTDTWEVCTEHDKDWGLTPSGAEHYAWNPDGAYTVLALSEGASGATDADTLSWTGDPSVLALRHVGVTYLGQGRYLAIAGLDTADIVTDRAFGISLDGSGGATLATVTALDGQLGARQAPVLETDPISGWTYLFGGAGSDNDTRVVDTPAETVASASNVVPSHLDIEIVGDAQSDGTVAWSSETTFTVDLACPGGTGPCVLHDFWVTYMVGIPADVQSLEVSVECGDGTWGRAHRQSPWTESSSETVVGESRSAWFRSPCAYGDHDSVDLRVAGQVSGSTTTSKLFASSALVPVLESFEGRSVWRIPRLPARVGTGDNSVTWELDLHGPDHSLHVGTETFTPVAVGVPDGVPVASSVADAVTTHFSVIGQSQPQSQFSALAWDGLTAVDQNADGLIDSATVGSTQVFSYAMADLTHTTEALDYLDASVGYDMPSFEGVSSGSTAGVQSTSLQGDVDQVQALLGPYPFDAAPVILVRDSTQDWIGITVKRIVLVSVEQDGDLDGAYVLRTDFPVTSVHEFTHHWFGGSLDLTPETDWVGEAFAQLVAETVHPLATWRGHHSVMYDGASSLLVAEMDRANYTPSLEDNDAYYMEYRVGPYILAQLIHIEALLSSRTPQAVLADLGAWAAGAAGAELATATELKAAFIPAATGGLASPALTTAWDEWVDNRTGAPIVHLDTFSYDTTSGSLATHWRVRQVQTDVVSTWPKFTYVPFYLGCDTGVLATSPAFSECDAARNGTVGAPRYGDFSSASEVTGSLTASTNPMPVYVALLAHHHLVPGHQPAYDFNDTQSARSASDAWAARCEVDACTDADSDGHDWGFDCADSNPLINRLQSDDLTGNDANCDPFPHNWSSLSVKN